MPKKSKTETDVRITIAAGLFVIHTRDAQEIASMLDTTERNVYRWSKTDLWEEILQTLNYKGEQHFRLNLGYVQKNTENKRLKAIVGSDGNIINWDQVVEIEMESNTGKSKPDEYTIYAHGHGGARTIINSGSLDACIIIMTEIKSEIADSNSSGIFDVSDFKRSSNFRERLARLA